MGFKIKRYSVWLNCHSRIKIDDCKLNTIFEISTLKPTPVNEYCNSKERNQVSNVVQNESLQETIQVYWIVHSISFKTYITSIDKEITRSFTTLK